MEEIDMGNQLENVLQLFLKEYQFRLKEASLIAYAQNISEFFLFINKQYPDISSKEVRAWLTSLLEIGRKPATIHQKMAALRLFFSYLMEEKRIEKHPCLNIPLPKIDEQLPRYLTRAELGELRDHVKHSKREAALIETFYTTGVRLCELVDMKQTDISWEERSIHIREGKGKKERIVLFNWECKEKLHAYLNTRTDSLPHLFLNSKGNPVQQRALRLTFERYTARLGFKVSPHTMRHTFAAHLAEKGMPLVCIQDLLGHDRIEVTKVYTRLHEEAKKVKYDYYE